MSPSLLLAFAAALIFAALIAAPLLFSRRGGAERAAHDAAVFRDQLAEVERDRARGTLSESEAAGTRAEISRRLIAATRRAETAGGLVPAPRGISGLMAGLSILGVPVLAAGIYLAVGAPQLPDQPLAARGDARTLAAEAEVRRPTQAEAERRAEPPPAPPETEDAQRFAALIERLEGIVAERPQDTEGRRMLAQGYMRLQRYGDAWPVYARLAEIRGPAAGADLFADQAQAMILATGGYVSPEAETVIDRALRLDPATPTARFFQGLAEAQRGRLQAAVAIWEALQPDVPQDARWRPWLAQMLDEARRQTGAAAAGGQGAAGPTRGEMEAAGQMSAEERQAMIAGMVDRLETRLAERGGPPEDWVRLIRAYDVLDRRDDARRIYRLSQDALRGSEAGFVREQALVMGVIDR